MAEPCNKKLCVDEEWSGDAYDRSLPLVRSGALPKGNIVGEPSDLVTQFPFVTEEFMALLLSVYSADVLRSVLSNDRVQALEIWIDFARGHYVAAVSPAAEQQLFDEYLKRFANLLLSMRDHSVKSDTQRWTDLRTAGRRLHVG